MKNFLYLFSTLHKICLDLDSHALLTDAFLWTDLRQNVDSFSFKLLWQVTILG